MHDLNLDRLKDPGAGPFFLRLSGQHGTIPSIQVENGDATGVEPRTCL